VDLEREGMADDRGQDDDRGIRWKQNHEWIHQCTHAFDTIILLFW